MITYDYKILDDYLIFLMKEYDVILGISTFIFDSKLNSYTIEVETYNPPIITDIQINNYGDTNSFMEYLLLCPNPKKIIEEFNIDSYVKNKILLKLLER